MAVMGQNGATMFQCGTFSGKGEEPATRWLRKLEWEMKRKCSDGKDIDPADLLQTVDFLVVGKAATWAESPAVRKLLDSSAPTADTVAEFTSLFAQRLPNKVPNAPTIRLDTEIAGFRQQEGEALSAYYQRATSLMARAGGRERLASASGLPELSPSEIFASDTIIRVFAKGIADPDLRRDALRGMLSGNRSLRGIYEAAEDALSLKAKFERLENDFALTPALRHDYHLYKDLVQRHIPTARVDSMKATYRANPEAWGMAALNYNLPVAPAREYSPPPQQQQQFSAAVRNDYRTNDYRPNDYRPNDYRPNDYRPNDYRTNNYRPNDHRANNYRAPYQPAPHNSRPRTTGVEGWRAQSSNAYINGSRTFAPGRGNLV